MRTQSKNFWTPPHIVKQQSEGTSPSSNRDRPNNTPHLSTHTSDQSNPSYDSSHPHNFNHSTQSTTSQQSIITIHSDNSSKSPPKTQKNTLKDRINDTLQPLKDFVESLPFFLQSSSQETALVLLNCADEITRRRDKVDLFENDPHYIPASARFKYTLTCSKLLTNDHIFLEASTKCLDLIKNMQTEIRKHTLTVVRREVWAAKNELLKQFITHGLTITRMLLIKEKTSNKFLYSTHDIPDNYISKVAFYKYIFDDSPKLSTYLHTNLDTITTHLQTHQTMSQDPYNLDDSTTLSSHPHSQPILNDTQLPDAHNDNPDSHTNSTKNTNKNTHHTPTKPSHSTNNTTSDTTHTTPPTPSPNGTTQSPEHAQLPPLPPNHTPTTTSIVNKTNVNINVNQAFQQNASHNNHNNNSMSLSNHQSTAHNNPYATPTQKSRNTTFTPKIANPYKNKTKTTHTTDTNQQNTPSTHQTIITPNYKNNNNTNPTTMHSSTQQHSTTDANNENSDEEQRIGLQDLLDLFDNPNPSRDITLETFPNHPQLQTLTNGIKLQLLNLLPHLTYKFFEQRQEKTQTKAGEDAALIWYEQQRTKTATEQVATALDSQPNNPPYPLLTEIIHDTVNKKVAATCPRLAKTVEKKLTKNFHGRATDQVVRPTTYTVNHTQTQRNNQTKTSPNTNNPTSIITWRDYLSNKQKKQQLHNKRTNRKNQNRNAKWNPPNRRKY